MRVDAALVRLEQRSEALEVVGARGRAVRLADNLLSLAVDLVAAAAVVAAAAAAAAPAPAPARSAPGLCS